MYVLAVLGVPGAPWGSLGAPWGFPGLPGAPRGLPGAPWGSLGLPGAPWGSAAERNLLAGAAKMYFFALLPEDHPKTQVIM